MGSLLGLLILGKLPYSPNKVMQEFTSSAVVEVRPADRSVFKLVRCGLPIGSYYTPLLSSPNNLGYHFQLCMKYLIPSIYIYVYMYVDICACVYGCIAGV